MNVLYLTSNPNRASSNVPTEGWFHWLRPRGLTPVLVSQRAGAFHEWARSQGIEAYELPLPFPDKTRVWSYAGSLWRLRRLVKQHRIDLIHAIEHTVYPIAGDLARLTGVPVAVGIHCRIERGFGAWAFGRWRRPQRLFFLMEASREVCREAVAGVVPDEVCRILPNGLDVERFRPDADAGLQFRAAHNLGSGPLLGAASWLRPGKQLEHLIRASATVADRDFTLVLAGGVAPGEEAYAEGLLAFARERLGPRLRYIGHVDDLRGFYNALTFYVNTSLEETCSISIMEALACGCPVLGYPSVSVGEQVLPTGGRIVPQNDEAALVAAMREWLQDPGIPASLRAGARARAVEMFDIRALSSRLWDDYAVLVKTPA